MRTDQDRFDRVVRTGTSVVRVRCRPRGSELRDLTDGADVVNWFSALPGLLSLFGWLLHRTLFGSKWSVIAEPLAAGGEPVRRIDGLTRADAERTFGSLVAWLENGRRLADFP